jgi:hypothetical protein
MDIHQYLVDTIGSERKKEEDELQSADDTSEVEINSIMLLALGQLQQRLTPEANYKHAFVVLDSDSRDTSYDQSGKLSWSITPYKNFVSGAVNTNTSLGNIVGMRMAMPRWEIIDVLQYMSDPIQRFTILIEELKSQAIIGPDGFKFHFMVTTGPQSNIDSASVYHYTDLSIHGFNQGYFWFRTPVSKIDRLTLSFGCPFVPFGMKVSSSTGTLVQRSNPMQINFDVSALLFVEPLVVSGFTTGNPTVDAALIASINTTLTPSAISRSLHGSGYIQFAIDTSAMTQLATAIQVTLTTSRYRMTFPLEFIYTDDDDSAT